MGTTKSFIDSLTAGEIAVLVGLIGALSSLIAIVVSIFTTRYIVKHGPNYGKQIGDLHATLDSLAKTQEEFRKQQAQSARDEQDRHLVAEKRAEAARWKPTIKVISKIENNDQSNYFRLESAVEFSLIDVSLCTQGGAKVHSFPNDGAKITLSGFTVTITREALNKISNNSPTWFHGEYFDAMIRYLVMRDGQEYRGDVPIQAKGVINGTNLGVKISG